MSVTSVGGHLVHYEVYGRGKPLVFIHGWLGSWRYWWPTMQSLSHDNRSFAMDLWGFGDSSKDRDSYALNDYIEQLNIFINSLGIATPINLVGHALGATIALRFTCLNQEAVNKLVLVSMPLSGHHINDQFSITDIDSFIQRHFSLATKYPEVAMGIAKADKKVIRETTRELMQDDFTKSFKESLVPILQIHGEDDSLVKPPGTIIRPNEVDSASVQQVILAGCDHFPMLEKPAVFNRLVDDFLSGDIQNGVHPKDYWQRRIR